jgi:multiple sugar transport system permease protein
VSPAAIRRRRRRRLAHGGRVLALAAMCVWVLFPFYCLLLVAFQSRAESLTFPPDWLPTPNFDNFSQILDNAFSGQPPSNPSDVIFPGIVNSAVVAAGVALVNVALGSLAGYAFARYRFFGSRTIPLTMLGSQMVPAFALIVPFYIVLRNLQLTNTRIGVVVALVSITLPFSVWLLRAYFAGIPLELERAARIDGCRRWTVFWRVVLPLARPGLLTVGLFAFMVAWNDFLFAVVLNANTDSMLVQPAIAGLYNVREQSFGIMAAGTLLAALPTVLLALVIQRFLVRGILSGVGKAQ